MSSDNASQAVIQHTGVRWKDSVRLYFRPRTPTQINNEGIRPAREKSLDSHCPVPVFLLFDSLDVLTRQSTLFSDRSLAKHGVRVGGSAAEFLKLPFQKIYHNTWFEPDERDEIVACRHAEVIVPRHLDLDALKYVWCRSQAEKTTLLHLLRPGVRAMWADRIYQGNKYDLFFNSWTFVERADLSSSDMVFFFNPSTKTPGPFLLRVRVKVADLSDPIVHEDNAFMASGRLQLLFKRNRSRYTVEVTLDESLAYQSEFVERDPVL